MSECLLLLNKTFNNLINESNNQPINYFSNIKLMKLVLNTTKYNLHAAKMPNICNIQFRKGIFRSLIIDWRKSKHIELKCLELFIWTIVIWLNNNNNKTCSCRTSRNHWLVYRIKRWEMNTHLWKNEVSVLTAARINDESGQINRASRTLALLTTA
jgi:hypothetical protein